MTIKQSEIAIKGPFLHLSLLEVAVLLYQAVQMQTDKTPEFEHPEFPFGAFIDRCNQNYHFNQGHIESLLYYSQLLNERKKFKHPLKLPLASMIKAIEKRNKRKFNSKYNLFERGDRD